VQARADHKQLFRQGAGIFGTDGGGGAATSGARILGLLLQLLHEQLVLSQLLPQFSVLLEREGFPRQSTRLNGESQADLRHADGTQVSHEQVGQVAQDPGERVRRVHHAGHEGLAALPQWR
jgi:hypothetical protein